MKENDIDPQLNELSKSACFICFWGQHNKCRFMRREYGQIKMPEDCPDFDPFPDGYLESL